MKAHRTLTRIAVLTAVSAAFTFAVSISHQGHAESTGVVKDRSELMKQMGGAMKVIVPMFKGEKPYDADKVREAAATIETHGGEKLTVLFPEGSDGPNSDALPAIWEEWETFAELADDLVLYAQGLEGAAGNPRDGDGGQQGGTLGGQSGTLGQQADAGPPRDPAVLATLSPDVSFGALGKTCGACHQQFRKDD